MLLQLTTALKISTEKPAEESYNAEVCDARVDAIITGGRIFTKIFEIKWRIRTNNTTMQWHHAKRFY